MRKKLTQDFIRKQLEFAVHVAIAMDMLAKHENDSKTTQGVVAQILMELGYKQEDSYGAAIALQIGGGIDLINTTDLIVTLPALVCTAAGIIDRKQIPAFVKDEVKNTLAKLG